MNRAVQEQEVRTFLVETQAAFTNIQFSVATGLRNMRAWRLVKVVQ